jgi:hypothetical protein
MEKEHFIKKKKELAGKTIIQPSERRGALTQISM